jgi:hypothetical protein
MANPIVGILLMAASNAVSWHVVWAAAHKSSSASVAGLRSVVWKVALFYMLWALYNKYLGGRPQELGHVSFGLLVASCLGTARFQPAWTRIPLVASCLLVLLNFAVVLPFIAKMGGIRAMAKKIKRDPGVSPAMANFWGYSFVAYLVSNVVLWSYCIYLFSKLPLESASSGDREYTTPSIEEVDYQPVETADV